MKRLYRVVAEWTSGATSRYHYQSRSAALDKIKRLRANPHVAAATMHVSDPIHFKEDDSDQP